MLGFSLRNWGKQKKFRHTFTDADGADGHHGVLRPALFIPFHRRLHCQASVEANAHEGLEGDEIGEGGQGAVLAEGMACERRTLLNESFRPHVFESCLFEYCDGGLGKLRGI